MTKRFEVHGFAGLGGIFFDRGTRALDRLFDDLSPVWDCNHWQHRQWTKVARDIAARQKFHQDDPVVILFGHSFGALRCLQISVVLQYYGIEVAYIGCIDATALPMGAPLMVVPDNVTKVDEFWATSGIPYSARRRKADGSAGGRYVFKPDWKGQHTLTPVPGGHIPCASAEITRRTIVASVKEIIQ